MIKLNAVYEYRKKWWPKLLQEVKNWPESKKKTEVQQNLIKQLKEVENN